ncbi:MAG: DUF1566 domain-containing protein [Planctomycetes bacterium]|nr:DUF1566 domain-containing protein [Planctomycetota bacterium]
METKGNNIRHSVWLAVFFSVLTTVCAQPVNDIVSLSPDSAPLGGASQIITFTLDTGNPPAPPAGVVPQSVTIGDFSGSSLSHPSQYEITAEFTFPAHEPPGAKDVSISFVTPQGHTLAFSMMSGFTLREAGNTAPTITQQPESLSVYASSSATFTVSAWGTEPMTYQWYRDEAVLAGATDFVYSIVRVGPNDVGDYDCIITNDLGSAVSTKASLTLAPTPALGAYPIVDTGQMDCYDDAVATMAPIPGEAYDGQDAQHQGFQPSYALSDDGLTVLDYITGLTWTQSPDLDRDGDIDAEDKLSQSEAVTYPTLLNAQNYGGYNDWRLPSIKEIYSLMNFAGTDPSGPMSVTEIQPFIDTDLFAFGYGDTDAGERDIDAQFATTTLYGSTTMGGNETMFGLNLADGRIKGYPVRNKTYYVYFVRGNTDYGVNIFMDNGDGTVSDHATGLMWAQDDSAVGMNWEEALAWVQTANAVNHLGHDNWRLPNAKELQSLVDYARSPDTTDSAAINAVFHTTPITNEAGQTDYPWFWSSTTHVNSSSSPGSAAAYVCFGRALGYWSNSWQDVHGAGCQRSDPKLGDPEDWATGHGPQGDAIRIYNFVRIVRDNP